MCDGWVACIASRYMLVHKERTNVKCKAGKAVQGRGMAVQDSAVLCRVGQGLPRGVRAPSSSRAPR